MMEQIERLISEHINKDNPVCAYIYDIEGMKHHVKKMVELMPKQTFLFYAIKANPDKEIIKALLPLVKGFEVASIGELLKVREVSQTVPVLFGGPGKKDYELKAALQENVSYIHIESLLELRRLIILAKELNKYIKVLLRINLKAVELPITNISMGGRPSQFGLDEDKVEEAITLLFAAENTHIQFSGFHFHSLSNNLEAASHVEMILHYIRRVKEWEQLYALDVQLINVGGGFGVSYEEQFEFNWREFITLLTKSTEFQALEDVPIYFEPGRIIVAEFGYYVTEIIDIKKSYDQFFGIVRGGTHHNRLPVSWDHNQPFTIIPQENWSYPFKRPCVHHSKVTIVGELCTPKDQFYKDAFIEKLRVGDIIMFEKSGAYCWTISHHDFLGHPHPDFHYIMEGNNYV